jgi:dTDP-4-dehydrorhamnose reductase
VLRTREGGYGAAVRILVVGGSGFLGGELVRQAAAAGHEVVGTSLSGSEPWRRLDICRRDDVLAAVAEVRPDVVVNAAFRQHEWAPTADGPAHLAVAAGRAGCRFVHVSSDVVFSGAAVHYDETAPPDPITPYGAAKAAAETAVRASLPAAVIVRTSLIIGAARSSTEQLVHELCGGADGVLFTDDVRTPVHVADLAAALLELAVSDRSGIHHVAGPEALDRHTLGRLIASRDGLDPDALRPGTRAGSGVPGPLDVRLDSRHTQAVLTTRLRGATEFLG